jgi:hypothetical protein
LHCGFDVLFAGLLMDADDLRRREGFSDLILSAGLDALAADDEVILAAELSAHAFDGGAHLAGVVFVAKIVKRFVDERALMALPWGILSNFEA